MEANNEKSVVMINIPKLVEGIKFRKVIEVLPTYQSEDKYIDSMIVITQRNMPVESKFSG